jgi:hypothetical protein
MNTDDSEEAGFGEDGRPILGRMILTPDRPLWRVALDPAGCAATGWDSAASGAKGWAEGLLYLMVWGVMALQGVATLALFPFGLLLAPVVRIVALRGGVARGDVIVSRHRGALAQLSELKRLDEKILEEPEVGG